MRGETEQERRHTMGSGPTVIALMTMGSVLLPQLFHEKVRGDWGGCRFLASS